MRYGIDLDGTICLTEGADYSNSKPNKVVIDKVNKLYDEFNEITIFTARGALSGFDYRELTEYQLKQWGVKYHELLMNKPFFNVYVGDEVMSVEDFISDKE